MMADNGAATLKQPGMRALLGSEIISTFGSQLTAVALPWFVLTTSGSPARAGLVLAAQFAPVVLFGVVSGSWVERIGARRWMLLSDGCRAPLIASIPLLSALAILPFGVLLLVVFAVGFFFVPYTASQQVLVTELVGEDPRAVVRATSLLQSATRITMMLGPPLAGLVTAVLGPRAALLVDACSYLAVVGVIAMGTPRPRVAGNSHDGGGVLAGLHVLFRDRLLAYWTTGSVLSEAAYQALFLAVPVLVLNRYHESATTVGFLIAAFGVGAVTGSLLAARLSRQVSATRLSLLGKIPQALLFVVLVPALPVIWLGALMILLGATNGLSNGPSFAVRIARIPESMRARALTTASSATSLGGTIGLALAGPAFEAFSYPMVFVMLAALQIASVALYVKGVWCVADEVIRRDERTA